MSESRLRSLERAWWQSGAMSELEPYARQWQRSTGGDLFDFRIRLSGLFESLGENEQGCAEHRHLATGMVMVRVEKGELIRSGLLDGHPVSRPFGFHRPFLVCKHPVSQDQWTSVMAGNPSRYKATVGGDSDLDGRSWGEHPVDQVKYEQALKFCAQTSTRLLSESLWDYTLSVAKDSGIESLRGMPSEWVQDHWTPEPFLGSGNGFEATQGGASYNNDLWLKSGPLEMANVGFLCKRPPPAQVPEHERVSLLDESEDRITGYGLSARVDRDDRSQAVALAVMLDSDGNRKVIEARDESDPTKRRARPCLSGDSYQSEKSQSPPKESPAPEGADPVLPSGRGVGWDSEFAGPSIILDVEAPLDVPLDMDDIPLELDDAVDVEAIMREVGAIGARMAQDFESRVLSEALGINSFPHRFGHKLARRGPHRLPIGPRSSVTMSLRVCWA